MLQFCFTNANLLLVCEREYLSKNEFEFGHLGGEGVTVDAGGFVRHMNLQGYIVGVVCC